MTTIVTDGKFLIADHRVTTTFQEGVVLTDIFSSANASGILSDSIVKIKLIDDTQEVRADGHRVRAYALAGSADVCARIRKFLKAAGPIVNLETMAAAMSCLGASISADMVFICDNNVVGLLEFSPVAKLSYGVAPIVLCRGSGITPFQSISNQYVDVFAAMTLEDKFLTAAMLDEYSSMSYSVYSIDEHVLYPYVMVDQADVTRKRKEILGRLMESKLGKIVHHNSRNSVA